MFIDNNVDEVSSANSFSNSVYKTIYLSLKDNINNFYFLTFLGFMGRACLLINANIIGIWVDKLCVNNAICENRNSYFKNYTFDQFFTLLLFLSFIGFALSLYFRFNISKIGTLSTAKIYDETTYRVSRFPIHFFDTNQFGKIITRFSSDYSAITRMSGGPLAEVLSLIFDLVLFCLLILLASPYFFPVLLFLVGLNFYLYKKNKFLIRKERRQLNIYRAPTITHFSETIQGAKVIKVYGKENVFTNKFNEKLKEFIFQRFRTLNLVSFFSLKMSFLNIAIFFITGALGAFLMKFYYISLGSLIVVLTFILMTSSSVQVFFEWLALIEEALTGIERLDSYLKMNLEEGNFLPIEAQFNNGKKNYSSNHLRNVANPLNGLKNAKLTVKNLSLRYFDHTPIILKDISFDVEAGEKIGIIGKTGSGKSSLINAIFYLYPFLNGKITINNYEPILNENKIVLDNYISLKDFRSSLSLISQEPILFSGTLRDNLILDKNISDDEIFEVTKKLGLRKVFSSGKKILDTEMKENGGNFSLGEKQLLCMTRCLLQNRPIVLMDEATSSIDPYSEELLVNATNQFLHGKTQIIVAHQLSTVEKCDRILWLDSGKIIQFTSPEIVLKAFKNFEDTKFN
ncbi:ABC transporter ATP-binding protein/permease [Pigmentibacter sp. JX0631]|uniref:ABC transporter ATP-binding protein n=1 Tax=Pigmentibacter sp. JX0631 TaxID=2976982 RepID=UPI0024692C34|nr:ABC transporter ATP-binding protein/permease [Pigmentibacter sp. JX0631]WGL60948.1 ABC transporter ATP-binding protein/permease [Pigmentibacter sp. JX0631]